MGLSTQRLNLIYLQILVGFVYVADRELMVLLMVLLYWKECSNPLQQVVFKNYFSLYLMDE